MITNPHYGWCDFKLGNFEGHPSYLTDVPVDLLDAFIDYHEKGSGVAWFDEEGTEFTLIITPYSMFVIEEKEAPVLHDFSEIKFIEVEKELINDIENNINGWSQEFVTSDDEEEIKLHRDEIRQKLAILKQYVKKMDSNPKYVERK